MCSCTLPYSFLPERPFFLAGVPPGDGAGDPPGAHGPGRYLSPYMLLTAPGRQHAGPLLRAAQCGGAAGRLSAPSCGRLGEIKLAAARGGPRVRPDTVTDTSTGVSAVHLRKEDWAMSVLFRLSCPLFLLRGPQFEDLSLYF